MNPEKYTECNSEKSGKISLKMSVLIDINSVEVQDLFYKDKASGVWTLR